MVLIHLQTRQKVILSIILGGHLMHDAGKADSNEEGAEIIWKSFHDGSAKQKFIDLLEAQGVDTDTAHSLFRDDIDLSSILPSSKFKTDIPAEVTGMFC